MKYSECAVGAVVYALKEIIEPANDCHPSYVLAVKGTRLIIRKVAGEERNCPVSVSHEDVTDNSFLVSLDEISLIDPLITKSDQDEYKRRTGRDHTAR